MGKIAFWLLSIIGLLVCSSAGAEVMVSVQTIESQVWLQQGNSRSILLPGTRVKSGEIIVTGNNGRAELQLADAALQISSNTEITFDEDNDNETEITELHVHKGQVCVKYRSGSSSDKQFKLNIGGTMFIAMSFAGDVCVQRHEKKSSIELLKGSVQVTHFVDPSLIILSQSGTEFQIEDNGAYRLTVPNVTEPLISEAVSIEVPETVIEESVATEAGNLVDADAAEKDLATKAVLKPEAEIKTDNKIAEKTEDELPKTSNVSDEMLQAIDTYISPSEAPTDEKLDPAMAENPDPPAEKNRLERIYTVYLFSTRSEEVAKKVNRRFKKAQHNTQIITSNDGSVTRYRVAVSGFTSLQAAKDFSSSIVGKLGVKDTWIGKQ